ELNKFIKYCHHGNKDSSIENVSISHSPLLDYESFDVVDENPESSKLDLVT
nr:hypothetical protein [Bacteroidota bacterium]